MTQHFELLNYSDFGTTVDHVLYSCDFSDKPASTPQPSPVVAAVRDIIGKNRKHKEKRKEEEDTVTDKRYIMAARSREVGVVAGFSEWSFLFYTVGRVPPQNETASLA